MLARGIHFDRKDGTYSIDILLGLTTLSRSRILGQNAFRWILPPALASLGSPAENSHPGLKFGISPFDRSDKVTYDRPKNSCTRVLWLTLIASQRIRKAMHNAKVCDTYCCMVVAILFLTNQLRTKQFSTLRSSLSGRIR